MSTGGIEWAGRIVGVQPRIRLHRSFDQRWHTYQGYALHLEGTLGGEQQSFCVGIGKAAQAKHALRAGDEVRGVGQVPPDAKRDAVDLYRVNKLAVVTRAAPLAAQGPPFMRVAPDLDVYKARGMRRLSVRTFKSKCAACIWGCLMAAEVIKDQWNAAGTTTWRRETFCYAPKACTLHNPGPTRKVPGRKGMVYEEEDWIDEDATQHRGPNE